MADVIITGNIQTVTASGSTTPAVSVTSSVEPGVTLQGQVTVGASGADGTDGVGVPAGGTTDQVLTKVDNTDYNTEWTTPTTGTGDVVGAASSTDSAIALFDGTDGKLLKDSAKTVPTGDIVGTSDTQVLTNKTFTDSTFFLQDDADNSKKAQFQLSSVGGTRTYTLQNASGTIYISGGNDVTVADGGTGRSTSTTAYGLIAAGTTATGAHQTLPAGATTDILVGGGASALPAWTTATGTGAPVRANSPALVTPTGIVKGDVGLGNVDNTSDATKNSATATLTNKRITPRTGTVASSATPTINTDNVDFYSITALTTNITSMTTNLSGTPTTGQTLWIAITGTAARTIAWGASFEASTVALPTTTVSTNRLDVGFIWTGSIWRCVAVA